MSDQEKRSLYAALTLCADALDVQLEYHFEGFLEFARFPEAADEQMYDAILADAKHIIETLRASAQELMEEPS